jgi:NAD(P)-dependent dehydrogenase (short-subunit alcohol dehydrogenase family)
MAAFAEAGAAVVLVDINESALRPGGLTSAGHRAISVTCNVADEAQAAAMVERTVATFELYKNLLPKHRTA